MHLPKRFVSFAYLGLMLLLVTPLSAFSAEEGANPAGKGKNVVAAKAEAAKAKFSSKVITTQTPGHAQEIDADITGARQLYLVVTDAGNGYSCDWADWAEPRLIGPGGEKKLTDLKWKSASSGYGSARVNKNNSGQPLGIAGKPVSYGIGTHANSMIVYDLPKGFTRFKARGGLDDGGTYQSSCGNQSSVRFMVFTHKPPASLLRATANRGGGLNASRDSADAVAGLDLYEGLQATLFACEPAITSVTNLDIDHRGRIWVCEVMNYRGNRGRRPEGDRILILEDTNGDGKSDKTTVYYQGRDVDSAMGICVLGNQVIVSCAPNILVFTDTDGDDKPDKKEFLFTKTGQEQHDHSAHSFVFGTDGKLYWNYGNTGRQVADSSGKVVVDKMGNQVIDNGRPYRGGMVFRCDTDGSNFEVLGHNFRNNYELAVDSFGTIWQSDNDDDGNRGVRINYVMEYGNYGYKDEITGAAWTAARTGMNTEKPLKHWHLRDPGVVPNLLQTYAGSPTGICVYEGRLLPKIFWDQVIHCDAGPNVVRAYPASKDGAGYKAEAVEILKGARDNWFRPADVCVAPDGSLFVTDWYDPAVGGHAQRDLDRGRIFRVAPQGNKYKVPKHDFKTIPGALSAMRSPSQSVRYLAWTALKEMNLEAGEFTGEVIRLADSKATGDTRLLARLIGMLANTQHAEDVLTLFSEHHNPDIQTLVIRLLRQKHRGSLNIIAGMADSPSAQVRRECLIALRESDSGDVPKLWAELASKHDGKDRWYLEALGIGAHGKWDACLDAYLEKVGDNWNTLAGRDIIWRSRAVKTSSYLAKIIADPTVSAAELPRYFRAFDFQTGEGKQAALVTLAFATPSKDAEKLKLIGIESIKRLRGFDLKKNPRSAIAMRRVLDGVRGTSQFVELVSRFDVADRYGELLTLAAAQSDSQVGVEAIRVLLAKNQADLIGKGFVANNDKQIDAAVAIARVLGNAVDARAEGILMPLVKDSQRPTELRQQAARSLGKTRGGALALLKMINGNTLPEEVRFAPALVLNAAGWDDVRSQARRLFPPPPSKNNKPLPPLSQLLRSRGDVKRGLLVFETTGTCAKCHTVAGKGKQVGPDLSEIGAKLSRTAMFESILYPSAGISHNFETHTLALEDGNVVTGIITSRTGEEISIKSDDAIVRTFKTDEIDVIKKLNISLMPADLQKTMTAQELIDVVNYLSTLKKAAK